jgi:hypothetical protein
MQVTQDKKIRPLCETFQFSNMCGLHAQNINITKYKGVFKSYFLHTKKLTILKIDLRSCHYIESIFF